MYLSEPQMVCYGLDDSLLLNAKEASKALSISERSLWTLTANGEIPHIRIGRSVRYPVSELKDWLSGKVKHGQRLQT